MAIAFDTSSGSLSNGGAYTIGSGNNFFFFVTDAGITPPTASLGGVALTFMTSINLSGGACGANYEHYYYGVGIPSGSQTFVLSNGGGGIASSYTGVNQTTPVTNLVSGNYAQSTGPSVTPTNANSWVLMSGNACFNWNMTSSTIGTYRAGVNNTGQRIVDGNGILSGAQSVNNATSGNVSIMMFALNTTVAATANSGFFFAAAQ